MSSLKQIVEEFHFMDTKMFILTINRSVTYLKCGMVKLEKKFLQAERAPQTLGLPPGKSTGCILSCAYK